MIIKFEERRPDVFKSKYNIDVIVNTHAYKKDGFRKQVYRTDLQSRAFHYFTTFLIA